VQHLPGLHQRERLEEFVERAEPSGNTTKASAYLTNMVVRTKKYRKSTPRST